MEAFDREEFERWLSQAKHTLASAERDAAEGDFGWACFKAQQAGEYALKSLLRGLGQAAHGHVLRRLLATLASAGISLPSELLDAAQKLDLHYIPTRYPDAYPEGSPHEYYNHRTAEEATGAAHQIVTWVQSAA
ncbi:MAG: HEPN domain-containing protein [Deinococcota bacterium]|nr:HEPN domain-containing protein [Deinococcota bacterium]